MVEAMACGTPVVTTNWGAAPELVEDGVTGFRRDGEDDLVETVAHVGELDPAACRAPGRGALLRRGDGPRLRGGLPAGARHLTIRISTTAVVLLQWRSWPSRSPRPALRIDDLHVAVDGHEILRGVALTVGAGTAARPDGPERIRQVDARQHPARQPRLHGHRRDASSSPARTSPTCPPTSAPRAACSSGSSTPRRSRACRCSTSCARRSPTARASTTSPCSRCGCSS